MQQENPKPGSEAAARKRMEELKKKNPSANYSVIQGKKSGNWHVVRHTSGGMHMVENESFDDYLEYFK